MVPLIGRNKAIIRIKEMIEQLAYSRLNVLITGETGVGKEVVAQNLYFNSSHLSGNFIKVNCAALPESLLESELFGYEKGAFTDAHKKHKGKFLTADKGVLFLDEIGDMPLGLQSKILHVLEDGRFSPLGADKDIQTNAWIISATNHILEERIITKKFREDLFYRLNTINIHIPALRHRKEDIPLLLKYYFDQYRIEYSLCKSCEPDLKVIEKLVEYSWPGNVRQLQNCIKKYMVMNSWDMIFDEMSDSSTQDLGNGNVEVSIDKLNRGVSLQQQNPILNLTAAAAGIFLNNSTDLNNLSLKGIKKQTADAVEKQVIRYILEKTSWNKSVASKVLEISYKTLLYKIDEFKIKSP